MPFNFKSFPFPKAETFNPMTEVGFVRLYNKEGKHLLSIIPCDDGGADIATPDGKVLYCGVDYDILRILMGYLGKDTFDTHLDRCVLNTEK